MLPVVEPLAREVLSRGREKTMLPSSKKPTKESFNISIERVTVHALDEVVQGESVKSRNSLIGSFLQFAVELFQLKRARGLTEQLQEFKEKESVRLGREVTDAEVDAALIERGLKASKK